MPVKPPPPGPAPVQRLRITFAVSDGASYVSHLDLTRTWVRALRRLQVPVAYSHGYSPHPRVSVAAPLPVGFSGERELLDLYLDAPVDPQDLARRLQTEVAAGLALCAVEVVPVEAPPLPAQVRAADYVVSFYDPPPADLLQRVQRLMAAESYPFTRVRGGKEVSFDLRPRILQAEVEEHAGRQVLSLRLVHGPAGAARPEDVLTALELSPENARIVRTGLVLAGA